MTYHKRSTQFELPYIIEENIDNFSFLKNYEVFQEKISHLSVFDAYLIRHDETGTGGFNLFFKSIAFNKMYFIQVTKEFSACIEKSELISNFVGDKKDFLFEFRKVHDFQVISG